MKYDLLAYSMDFASFLVMKLGDEADKIKAIVLFGSVARGEATEKSDIDIFVEVFSDEKGLSAKADRIKEDFYKSVKFTKFYKLMNIANDIKPIIGRLDEWRDLEASVMANGIVLYGRYSGVPAAKKRVILLWENVKPPSKRVMINRQLFGYTHYRRKYQGLLQKYQGTKLGKGAIEVPIESYHVFMKLFRAYRVAVKIKYVMV